MHRRVFRRVCRCPSIDSAYFVAAGARRHGHSRGLHSSALHLQNDNQSAATTNSNTSDGGNGSPLPRQQFKPKFGGGWGSKTSTTSRSNGLTAAELASRNAIKLNASEQQQPPPQTLQQQQQKQQQQPQSQVQTNNQKDVEAAPAPSLRIRHGYIPDWQCPQCQFVVFGRRKVCPKCETPNPNPAPERMRVPKHPTDSRKSSTNAKFPPANWECSQCHYTCFGSHSVCPKCNTPKASPSPVPIIKHVVTDKKLTELSTETFKDYLRENAKPEGEAVTDGDIGPSREVAKPDAFAEEPELKATRDNKQDINDFDKWQASLEELRKNEELVAMQNLQRSSREKNGRRQRYRELEEDEYDPQARSQQREKRKQRKPRQEEVAAEPKPLYLPEFINVSSLANVLGVRQTEFIEHLEEIGFENVIHSHVLDAETAGLIAQEYNFEPIFETGEEDMAAAPELEDKSHLPPRPPVVTIMGHVDHGKTTLLDWLRKSSVAASEHGGITQHIGAFSVTMPSGKSITFLDTPGHAAFLDMRRRGADLTDIVVLVVAADDSVKPQTVEAIKHAKQANVPIIVAINKIDKDNVNPQRVKQDLARHSVDVEEFGGDVQAIPVSGKTGQGMLDLEDAIVTLSELLDHRADTECNAEGWVVEATTKKAGRVATVLVKRGTLRTGDILVAGTTWTRIKTLKNEAGVVVDEATPGMPIEIDGWKEQPEAGSEVLQAPNEQRAKEVVEYRLERSDIRKLGQDTAAINESRRETLEQRRRSAEEEISESIEAQPTGPKLVNFIIKADVSGSAEAVVHSVAGVGNNEILANVLRSGVGPVSEFDIKHAATSDASIISFNIATDPMISRMAEAQGVRLMSHNIIYELIDDVKATMSEHLPPSITSRVTGEAEISQQFEITVKGRNKTVIAGCKVRNGVISRSKKVRVLRDKEVIYDGSLSSLRNVKKDVTEMRKDTECGLGFQDWADFQTGDRVQSYEEVVEKRYLH